MRPCLVPTYIPELPVDPSIGIACANAACIEGYNTDYIIWKDANSRVTVKAPNANTASELLQDIHITR